MGMKMFLLLLPLVFLSSHVEAQGISVVDLSALREIKNSLTDITSSSFFKSWDFTATDPCSSFAGITCSSFIPKRVTTLTLGTGLSDSPGLAGILSPAICNLTELTQLLLYTGIVTGPIPSNLGKLKKLSVISLTNNRLTGSIPTSIFTLPNLHTLDLSHNQLTGTIPSSIYELSSSIKVVILGSNKLSGEIPSLPTELLHLDLSNNELSGMLPRKRMPLTLRYLSVSGNRLWGPLNILESLSELVYIDLSMNRFSGTIPSSLFRSTLSSMFLQRNNLTGRVPRPPPSATVYGPGSTVDLSHNSLTGELTNTLAGVETLFLNNNQFTGAVPMDYIENVYSGNTRTLYLQHNYIAEFPVKEGLALPDSVALCLSYNCMVPPVPVGFMACPASAGEQISRPANQCSAFNTSMAQVKS